MRVFEVLKPGLFTTVQDLGRVGYLKYGVPISGAMDTFSLIAANLLVSNDANDAGIEITLVGPELRALNATQIAVTGGAILPKINDEPVPMWQTLNLKQGDTVTFGRMEDGCRSYLSVRGGMDTQVLLGCRSTYVRGGFGGIDGRQLKTGDTIEGFGVPLLKVGYSLPRELLPRFPHRIKVYAVLGPQADMFTEHGIGTLFSNPYKLTPESDRMGYRLEGPPIEHRGKVDIVSDALLPGAIQVPKSGKPIVVMRDAQTTGGYPKIAVVITSDLSMLGQAKPNDEIQFFKTTVQEAHERLREHSNLLNILNAKMRKRELL